MNKLIYAIGIVVATTFSAHTRVEKMKVETDDSVKIENHEKLPQINKADTISHVVL